MGKITTPDFGSDAFKRQVNEAFTLYLKEQSSWLSIYLANGASMPTATNTKYEWLESQLAPQSWTVNGAKTIGTFGTTVWTAANIVFDSTDWLKAGDIVRFINWTTGSPVWNIQLQIVSVTNGTVATAYIYGWTTDVAIPDNAIAKFISNPQKENNKVFNGANNWVPAKEYNYTQIFEETIELSNTALASISYGDASTMAKQLSQGLYKIEQQMSEASVFGRRVERTGSGVWATWTFGWIEFFIDVANGNVIDASNNPISTTLINDLWEEIKKDGGVYDTIMCNFNQARKISSFNTSGSNPITQVARSETSAGSYVMNFVGDIPVAGWIVSRIIVDEKIPNDRVYLVNSSKIKLVPMEWRALFSVDGTIPWQDGMTMILRGEYTLVVEDAKYSHWVLKGLTA